MAELPGPLPLAEGSVGVIRAVDFLEHVPDKVALINELYRLLAPGGLLFEPNTEHRRSRRFPGPHARGLLQRELVLVLHGGQLSQLRAQNKSPVPGVAAWLTSYPSEWHAAHDISYVTANLIALKEPMDRNGGLLFW